MVMVNTWICEPIKKKKKKKLCLLLRIPAMRPHKSGSTSYWSELIRSYGFVMPRSGQTKCKSMQNHCEGSVLKHVVGSSSLSGLGRLLQGGLLKVPSYTRVMHLTWKFAL